MDGTRIYLLANLFLYSMALAGLAHAASERPLDPADKLLGALLAGAFGYTIYSLL